MNNFKRTPKEDGYTKCATEYTLVMKVRNFSSNTNVSRISILYEGSAQIHHVFLYANGRDNSTKGYVSLEFRYDPEDDEDDDDKRIIGHTEVIGSVAVVDAEGCTRFPQSFAFTYDLVEAKAGMRRIRRRQRFFFDKYISCDFLRADAGDLIPEDTLSIQVDLVVKECHREKTKSSITHEIQELVRSSFSSMFEFLLLESPMADLLRRESRFFERLVDTPMAEKDSGYLKIRRGEYQTLYNIVTILFHLDIDGSTLVFHFQNILDIYAMAHLYGIDSVLDACRCWLRFACRRRNHASEVSTLADLYDDPFLKKAARGISLTSEDETEVRGKWYTTREPDYKQWTCTPLPDRVHFVFERHLKMEDENLRSEHVSEDLSDISNSYI